MTCDLAGGYGTLLDCCVHPETLQLLGSCCGGLKKIREKRKLHMSGISQRTRGSSVYYMNVSRSLIVDDRRIGVKGSVVGTTYNILLNFIIIEDCGCEPFPYPVPFHPPHRCALLSDLLDGASQISIGVFWLSPGSADSSQR